MGSRAEIARLAAEADATYVAGNYKDAAATYRAALAMAEGSGTVKPLELASLLNNLAVVYKYLAEFDRAVELYRRSLDLTQQELGPTHPGVATLFHNLGGLEHARGRYAEGEPFACRSVEI